MHQIQKIGAYEIGTAFGGLQNYTDSIYNCYVQNNQLTIVAMKEGYTSARLNSRYLQGFYLWNLCSQNSFTLRTRNMASFLVIRKWNKSTSSLESNSWRN